MVTKTIIMSNICFVYYSRKNVMGVWTRVNDDRILILKRIVLLKTLIFFFS